MDIKKIDLSKEALKAAAINANITVNVDELMGRIQAEAIAEYKSLLSKMANALLDNPGPVLAKELAGQPSEVQKVILTKWARRIIFDLVDMYGSCKIGDGQA